MNVVCGCVNSVKRALFHAVPYVQQMLPQFMNVANLCLLDALTAAWAYNANLVVNWVKIRTVGRPVTR